MQEETRHKVALARYKLISPVLAEPDRQQNEYFRNQSEKKHHFPNVGSKKVTVPTFKRWLGLYRDKGFDALKPKVRKDRGRPRKIGSEIIKAIEGKCKAFPNWTVQRLYDNLIDEEQISPSSVSYNTVLRLVRAENLLPKIGRTDVRKRYEVAHPNDLWVCDFMHGPRIKTGQRTEKAILCAVIDDHSRMIVGHEFSANENIATLTLVLKRAMLAFGDPKRFYVDNGAAFSADLLAHACARAGVALIHSKPYDPSSRGKIERFFRTVRDRFLCDGFEGKSLTELNEEFGQWLQNDYHHKHHSGIDQKPIERYHSSVSKTHINRLTSTEIDLIFLAQHQRIVGNDCTISFKGNIYEVPAAYVRQKVDVRHPVDNPEELFLFDNGVRITTLKLVDKKENARTFRPQQTSTDVSFAHRVVKS